MFREHLRTLLHALVWLVLVVGLWVAPRAHAETWIVIFGGYEFTLSDTECRHGVIVQMVDFNRILQGAAAAWIPAKLQAGTVKSGQGVVSDMCWGIKPTGEVWVIDEHLTNGEIEISRPSGGVQ